MRIYTCAPEWEAMLTTIYEAWSSKLGYENVKLLLEPVSQYTLFDEYVHVDADSEKATKFVDAISQKISGYFYRQMAMTAMAYEEDVLDNIYHMLILGFAFGSKALDMMQYKDVVRNYEIRTRVCREANRFQEIMRFHQVGNVYVAHFEPKSRVIEYLGPVFQDRMPSENFMIIDDVHKISLIHVADSPYFIRQLSEDEFSRSLISEEMNDEYTDLWKVFFNTIAIKERENYKCQMTHFPLWARAHAVEFMQ